MNPYPIENIWEKGHYVARIIGRHARYGAEREFLQGTPHKARGIVAYQPDDIGTLPAWIIRTPETRCGECGRPKQTEAELIAAHPHGWEVVARGLAAHELGALAEWGPPGTPGSWTPDDRCPDCGTPSRERCGECVEARANREALAAAPSPF